MLHLISENGGGKIVINRCFIGLYHKYDPELYAKIHSIAKKLYDNFYGKNPHTWSEDHEKTLLIKYTQEEFKGYGSLKNAEYMDFVPLVQHYYNSLKVKPDLNDFNTTYNNLNRFIIKNHKIIDESIIFDYLLVLHDEYQKYKSSEEDKNSDLKIESFEKFNKLFEISQNISKIQQKKLNVFKDFINKAHNLKELFKKNNKISIFDYYLFKAICKNFINEVKLKNINEVVELKNINKAKVVKFKKNNQEVMDRGEKIKNPKIIGVLVISSLSVCLMSIIPFYLNNPNLGYTILGIGLSIAVLGIATLLILDRDIYLDRWNNNLDLKKSELNEEQQKIVTDNNTIINDINQIINDLQSIDGAPKFDDKDPDTTLNSHNSTNLISNELNK